MITAARTFTADREKERGQSVLEFLLMLPLMLGLAVLLIRVNTAIQMAIVNQQYARAQALFLTMGSPVYPRYQQRFRMEGLRYNQLVMGVSENSFSTGGEGQAKASTAKIAKSGGSESAATDQILERSEVRIRNTVTLCTQPIVVNVGGSNRPILKLAGGTGIPEGEWNMAEKMTFDYCSGPLRYL